MSETYELAKAYVQIIPTTQNIKKNLSSALNNDVEAAGDEAGTKSGSAFSASFGSAMKTAAQVGVAAIGVAATAIGTLAKSVVNEYGEYEQLVGGAELMFGDAYDYIAEKAASAYSTVQMSQNDYLTQVNGFATGLKTALGGDEQAAAELADKIVTAEADVVAATGNSQEAVQNAFNGIMKSNYTMLDNLQIGITPTKEGFQEVIDKVNEWNTANGNATAYQIDNLADCQQALVDYIDMVGMSGYAQSEAAGTIQGSLASTSAAWSNLLAGLGDDNADIKQLTKNLVGEFKNVVTNVTPVIKSMAEALPVAFDTMIDLIPDLVDTLLPPLVDAVESLLDGVVDALPDLLGTIADVLPDLINLLTNLVVKIASNLDKIVKPVINAIPSIINALISGLITAVPQLVLGLGEMAGEAVSGLIDNLPTILVDLATAIPNAIVEVLRAPFALLGGILGGLLGSGDTWEVTPEMQVNFDKATADWSGLSDMLSNVEGVELDLSSLVSDTGTTYDDLNSAISEKLAVINQTISDSYGLEEADRQTNLQNIRNYMADLSALYDEQAGAIEGRVELELELEKANTGGTYLELYQQNADLQAHVEQAKELRDEEYQEKLDASYNMAEAYGWDVTTLQEYQAGLKAEYDQDIANLETYSTQSQAVLDSHNEGVSGVWDDAAKKFGDYVGTEMGLMYSEDLSYQDFTSNVLQYWTDYVEGLDEDTKLATSALLQQAADARDAGTELDSATKDTVANVLAAFQYLPSDLQDTGKAMIQGLIQGTSLYTDDVAEQWNDLSLDTILGGLSMALGINGETSTETEEIGQYVSEGIAKGLGDSTDDVAEQAGMTADELIDTLRETLKINSPSKVTTEIGEYVGKGLVDGLNDESSEVSSTAENIGSLMAEGIRTGFLNMEYSITSSMTSMMSRITSSIKSQMDIHSPSKLYRDEIGQMMALGIGEGFTDAMEDVTQEMTGAIPVSLDDFGSSSGDYTAGDNASISYGGFTINVYGSEGQSEEALADAVMAKIQSAIVRRTKVYG